MAQEFLVKLQHLLYPVAAGLRPGVVLDIKHFFGGAAAYADGRICISLTNVGLALKLPEDERAKLKGKGATPLRYFPKGPIKKDYVVVPAAFLDDPATLTAWAHKSIDYALTLPPPKPKKQR